MRGLGNTKGSLGNTKGSLGRPEGGLVNTKPRKPWEIDLEREYQMGTREYQGEPRMA